MDSIYEDNLSMAKNNDILELSEAATVEAKESEEGEKDSSRSSRRRTLRISSEHSESDSSPSVKTLNDKHEIKEERLTLKLLTDINAFLSMNNVKRKIDRSHLKISSGPKRLSISSICVLCLKYIRLNCTKYSANMANYRCHFKAVHLKEQDSIESNKSSWIWSQFTYVDKKSVSCNACDKVMRRRTGNLTKHLNSKHDIFKHSLPALFSGDETEEEDAFETKLSACDKQERIKKVKIEVERNEEEHPSKKLKIEHDENTKQRFILKIVEDINALLSTTDVRERIDESHLTTSFKLNKISMSVQCLLCAKQVKLNITKYSANIANYRSHLKAVHLKENDPSTETHKNFWIWSHFTDVNESSVRCNACEKLMCRRTATYLKKHLKSKHDIFMPSLMESSDGTDDSQSLLQEVDDSSRNFDESPWRKSSTNSKKKKVFSNLQKTIPIDTNNCFVCSAELTSSQTKLTLKTKFTEKPLYEIIESFTGVKLDQNTQKISLICHECLNSFQQYDEWQFKLKELQHKVKSMLSQKYDSAQVIKQEPSESGEDEWWSNEYNTSDSDLQHKTPSPKRKKVLKAAPEKVIDLRPPLDEESYCVTCSIQFENVALFEIHLATDHERSDGPFKCPKCSKATKSLSKLKNHYMIHSLPVSFVCDKCALEFESRACLENHMETHDESRPFICPFPGCSERFSSYFKRKRHYPVHIDDKNYECHYCPGRMFKYKDSMQRHVRKRHSKELSVSENHEGNSYASQFES